MSDIPWWSYLNSTDYNKHKSMSDKRSDAEQSLNSLDTSKVTDRSQIIDPYKLINPANYEDSRSGRLQYESDLQRALMLAERQEASYLEWYNSESQQAARQRAAGLNPDLLGVQPSSGSDTSPSDTVPGANIPTGDQMALQTASAVFGGLSSIVGVLNSVSGVMNTVSNIRLNKAHKDLVQNQANLVQNQSDAVKVQSDGQFLSNISNFVNLSSQGVSDMLAKAIQTEGENFDIAKFFEGDFSELRNSLLPSDDQRYIDAFDRVLRRSAKTHSDAYNLLANSEDGRKKYLSQLASSYYSEDDDEMVGQLSIVISAEQKLHRIMLDAQNSIQRTIKQYTDNIDVQAAAAGFNDENQFKSDYYSSLEGKVMAELDKGLKQSRAVIESATADVYGYLQDQYHGLLSELFPDRKSRIGWQIVAGSHFGWQDHLSATNSSLFNPLINNIRANIRHLNIMGDAATMQAESAKANAAAAALNASTNEARQEVDAVKSAASIVIPWIK